ncbi:naphthalene 1,2-dioxygenase [Burkholderia sp. WAC0059]|uniref:2Fe-2S iron-sulfur cluster-binding protein n=1 Tax=Burkholderia sp. WAC0059 TaxID=2066022 RepID=UPI000C7F1581|nr:2Fe-2S iron-sulfur cluster-binding protein [Burkholderia sp. WAC0059]PLZ00578.1 naphthalene 1,2-dioxygenase [Burkholderia sp. WAC0059]
MQLRVQPLGQSIDCAPGDNLLDTLRRAAVPISYSCSAGRCGTCRCRVVSGTLNASADADGSAPGTVLACQATLTGDCTIEIPEPDEVVVHPARIVKGTVVSIDAPVHDVRIVRFGTNRPLSFSPGQYATVQFAPGCERPYSMASIENDALLEFHIRIVPGGAASSHVAHALKPGDTARISGPLGTSYLRRKHDGPIVCVAGGTGLAPVLSIVRGTLEAGSARPVHLYFGVRSEDDLYGAPQLAELQRRYPNLVVHTVVANGPVQEGHRGGLVPAALEIDWPASDALAGMRAYVCGSPPMVDAVRTVLAAKGLPDGHCYADAFFAQSRPVPVPA